MFCTNCNKELSDGAVVCPACSVSIKNDVSPQEQGNTNAQCNLGLCYYNGDGVSKDFEEAFKWIRIAAINESEHAREFLERFPIINNMS
ncbi:MAG: zinc-ribbon domain-containing protein [Planctomycetaceae bacterium]|jgi:TPR repeat protein|nr:zinc-ribbon domain-containing protein [Planctomycetaceae bacterium]